MRGEFSETVQEHIVVDCRYPYEYDGGHIQGAVNIYTREALIEKFFNENANADSGTSKRKVIIFHCEFSSKRGPKLLVNLSDHFDADFASMYIIFPISTKFSIIFVFR